MFWVMQLCGSNASSQPISKYFDFWEEGKWVSTLTIFNGDTIPESDQFMVTRLQDKIAYSESWEIYIGDGVFINAQVLRAYDQLTESWKLFYVDDQSAQAWESKWVGDKLYFFKRFSMDDITFYSRQSWSRYVDGQVLRTIERSVDQQDWEIRYWQLFELKKG